MSTYTVKAGDSLSKIAANVMGNMALWPRLATANNIAAPYRIYPGQVLNLPGTSYATRPAARPGVDTIQVPGRPTSTDVSILPMPGQPGAPGASGGIIQWIIDNKLLVGGGVVLVAIIALAMGRKKKLAKKKHQVQKHG
jgi:hypothetical protein